MTINSWNSHTTVVGAGDTDGNGTTIEGQNAARDVNIKHTGSTQADIGSPMGKTERTVGEPLPLSGNVVQTTHGEAKLSKAITGETLVTLPSGQQLSWEQASQMGVLDVADQQQTQDSNANDQGQAGDVQQFANAVNSLEKPFTDAGIDPEVAIQHLATELDFDRADGTFHIPDYIADVMDKALGEDGTNEVITEGVARATQIADGIIKQNGLDRMSDSEQRAFANHVRAIGEPRVNQALVKAALGDTSELNNVLLGWRR